MAATSEEWKCIEESNGNYEVSNLGRVRNITTGQILKPRPTPNGYLRVHLRTKYTRKDFYIHRLVAAYFCNRPEGCDIINHLDCNPGNNAANNLEWTTQRDNVYYSMTKGRYHKYPSARAVIGIKNGIEIYFRSIHEAADFVHGDNSYIAKCCKESHRRTKGYAWKYAEVRT